ncbi:S8 family peptidase [Sorangium sp. So ce124]|uniref:S8 family peptidase n=1 Tax=Sorangium sp. So ce124 TaxID=3133280 RepID=UPI003F612C25
MAREHNFLLGQGERLVSKVQVPKAGGEKNVPYDLSTAKTRIAQRLAKVTAQITQLPEDACPRGEAVAVVTLHPRFLSKSDYPSDLFSAVGLRAVGSRSRTITPEKWGIERHGEDAVTEDIFVAGAKTAFNRWATSVKRWTESTKGAISLSHIEDLNAFDAKSKLRGIPEGKGVLLEVVLHNSGVDSIVLDFIKYAKAHNAEPLIARRRDVQGLTFLPVRVDPKHAEDIARFSFVRVARGMPTLRPFRPSIQRGTQGFDVRLPKDAPVDGSSRAVIFDGGIPAAAKKALSQWAMLVEPAGLGPSVPAFEEHGLGVTTAFLFGPLASGQAPAPPLCAVDHVRVLDNKTGTASDPDYFDVLDRIVGHLDKNPGLYSYVNISLGPSLAVDDDEVTLWTAALDKRFAHGKCVATVAAGNDGELDEATGLNRIQPPADGVNVLSVGAADRRGGGWQRAAYSCVGPGRSPGIVKPDGLAFGGSAHEPFGVLTPQLRGGQIHGTSFAAPFALRSAASIGAQLGTRLGPLAIRALLIHRAHTEDHHELKHVGWGRFEADPLQLVTCDDDETLVVFQGELPVGEHLRAPVPISNVTLEGEVLLAASLVIAPEVDPEHPGTYTRSGLEVAFRPHSAKFTKPKDGAKQSKHAKTRSFFSPANLYGQSESVLRDDGHKWEPCLHHEERLRSSSLSDPCFDIYYHHRESGMKVVDPQPIPYAFVVSLKAPKVKDLYNRVVRAYAQQLVPLRPQTRIQLRT